MNEQFNGGGISNTFPSGSPSQTALIPNYPAQLTSFAANLPTCNFGTLSDTGTVSITAASPDGVYCTGTGTIQIADSNFSGSFTLISNGGIIQFSGGTLNLMPFADNVLAYTTRTGDDAIILRLGCVRVRHLLRAQRQGRHRGLHGHIQRAVGRSARPARSVR